VTATVPVLALTLGDPVGIGPEIVAHTLASTAGDTHAHGVAVGDQAVLRRAARLLGLDVEVRTVNDFATPSAGTGIIDVLDIDVVGNRVLQWGKVDAIAGRAAVTAIEVATQAALDRHVAGIVTAPINKQAIWAAGSQHLGHTEMLGELTGSTRFNTMFVVRKVQPSVKIFFTTRHTSLRRAIEGITKQSVGDAIREALAALRVFGHDEPRLGVAALNPHGGEGGAFGDEELVYIGPACEAARSEGAQVFGPVPADSVFHQALQGRFDGVLSQFHDQGHIAAKTFDFDGTVSVTIGLPILRTSVDHGTAFDIAGTGKASPRTMRSAYEAAVEFAPYVDRIRAEYGGGLA
jgi:4-phospho-D-threonate 3-dehydrogenase / 4-phospho-D-erythronate 3-dehydrogenase